MSGMLSTRPPWRSGLLVGVLVSLVAAGLPRAGATLPRAGHPPTRYSGEALFNGIFMGTGPVADRLPELWATPDTVALREVRRMGKAEKARREVLAAIRAEDPAFLDWFGDSVQSGDHVRVEHALLRTAEVLEQVAYRRYGVDVRGPGSPSATCYFVAVPVAVVYFAVAVHTVAAVLIATYTAVILAPADDPAGGSAPSSLRKDWLVNLVTTRLAV